MGLQVLETMHAKLPKEPGPLVGNMMKTIGWTSQEAAGEANTRPDDACDPHQSLDSPGVAYTQPCRTVPGAVTWPESCSSPNFRAAFLEVVGRSPSSQCLGFPPLGMSSASALRTHRRGQWMRGQRVRWVLQTAAHMPTSRWSRAGGTYC